MRVKGLRDSRRVVRLGGAGMDPKKHRPAASRAAAQGRITESYSARAPTARQKRLFHASSLHDTYRIALGFIMILSETVQKENTTGQSAE